jgi:putative flippase GtrA
MSEVALPRLQSLTGYIPTGRFVMYLLVGGFNTAFAYGMYALITYLLAGVIPASYLAGSLLSSLLNITVSYFGYKWFVFKTRGNYLLEWTRCIVVYSGAIGLGLVMLPPAVFLIQCLTGNPRSAPYVAGALVLGGQAVISFVGHRNFTFRAVLAPKSQGGE